MCLWERLVEVFDVETAFMCVMQVLCVCVCVCVCVCAWLRCMVWKMD